MTGTRLSNVIFDSFLIAAPLAFILAGSDGLAALFLPDLWFNRIELLTQVRWVLLVLLGLFVLTTAVGFFCRGSRTRQLLLTAHLVAAGIILLRGGVALQFGRGVAWFGLAAAAALVVPCFWHLLVRRLVRKLEPPRRALTLAAGALAEPAAVLLFFKLAPYLRAAHGGASVAAGTGGSIAATPTAPAFGAGLAAGALLLVLLARRVSTPVAARLTLRPRQSWAALALGGLFFVVATLLPAPGPGAPASIPRRPGRPPDIVLVVVDSLGWNHHANLGFPPAETGVWFTGIRSNAPWTLPSFASLLTGRFPAEHHAGSAADDTRGGLAPLRGVTFPQLLAARGYQCQAVSQSVYLSASNGFASGFGEFSELGGYPRDYYLRYLLCFFLDGRRWFGLYPYRSAAESTGLARRLIADWDPARPHFLLLHYMDAHYPYRSGKHADGAAALEPAYRDALAGIGAALTDLHRAWGERDPAGENVFIVTADHGEAFSTDPRPGAFSHGRSLADDVLHVPLLLILPEARRALVSEPARTQWASLIDVGATVLDLAGVADRFGRGRSLLRDPEPSRPFLAEGTFTGTARAYYDDPFQLLVTATGTDTAIELYDLRTDPGSRTDLASREPARVRRLLAGFLDLAGKAGPARPPAGAGAGPAGDRPVLRTLGYLQ